MKIGNEWRKMKSRLKNRKIFFFIIDLLENTSRKTITIGEIAWKYSKLIGFPIEDNSKRVIRCVFGTLTCYGYTIKKGKSYVITPKLIQGFKNFTDSDFSWGWKETAKNGRGKELEWWTIKQIINEDPVTYDFDWNGGQVLSRNLYFLGSPPLNDHFRGICEELGVL